MCLGVVNNCQHLCKRTESTLGGGEGSEKQCTLLFFESTFNVTTVLFA